MKKITYLLFISAIVACKQPENSKKQPENKISTSSAHHPKFLLSEIKLHTFSDTVKQDTFRLQLTGKSIIDSKGLFEITSFNNRKIYSVKFVSEDLLGDMADILNAKQKEDTIKARFKKFFSESNFNKPTMGSRQELDTDYVVKEDYEDIKSDTSAVGFTYAMYYESLGEIAWSKKRKKVVFCFGTD